MINQYIDILKKVHTLAKEPHQEVINSKRTKDKFVYLLSDILEEWENSDLLEYLNQQDMETVKIIQKASSSTGVYSIKIPKIKKGTYVSVYCKSGGQLSAKKIVKAV